MLRTIRTISLGKKLILRRTCSTSSNGPKDKRPIVTILDAGQHKIGKYLALLLKQSPHLAELRLYDRDNKVCSIAEDLSHIDTRAMVKSYAGTNVLKYAVMDADLVVTVGGCRTKLQESYRDLFHKNVDDVRTAALYMIEFNPQGIFCITKPPIESFVPLVSEEYKKAGVYDSRKIIGITNIAAMRTNSYIALHTHQNAADILCPIIGGISKDCLVPVVSQSKPDKVHEQYHRSIMDFVSNCEDQMLKMTNSTQCTSHSLGISRFINSMLKALKGDTSCVDCAFVRQTGHIGQFLPYMTSVVRLGRHGIISCHMPKISGLEAHMIRKCSMNIKEYIRMGQSLVVGEVKTEKDKKKSETKI